MKQLENDLNNAFLHGSLTYTNAKSNVEDDVLTLEKLENCLKKLPKDEIYKPRFMGKQLLEQIYLIQYPTKTVPVKVHRKKYGSSAYHSRIQKKWNKRYGFKTVRDESVNVNMCYQTSNGTYVYPHVYNELKNIVSKDYT